jgi:phytoene dehydrogenase-like protein
METCDRQPGGQKNMHNGTHIAADPPSFLGENNLAKNKYARPAKLLDSPDAIVIGSGIGGLAMASILAQRKKWRVLLLEAGPVPGGSTRCWEWDGFEWNTGIDSIGDMDPSVGRGVYRPTIDYITGGHLQWEKMPDVHEMASIAGDKYLWYSSPEKNMAWVRERFAGQGGEHVAKYYELEERIEWWAWAWALTKILPEWLPEDAREVGYMLTGGAWRKYMQRTTTDVFVNDLGFSPKLASVFSYPYGNHGKTPAHSPFAFHAVNLYHFRNGAYYPVGGPAQIAECAIPIIEAAGGQLAVGCPVKRILVEKDTATGVELASGETIRAPLVISDTGAWSTFTQLLEPEVSERFGYAARFKEIGPSVAHLYLFLGYDQAIELPKEIIWHFPSYDIEAFDAGYKRGDFENSMGGYMLCPSARDPVYAQRYPNKSTVIALNEAPREWVERSKSDPSFRKELEESVGQALEKIVHTHCPQLKDVKPAFRRVGIPYACNPYAWQGASLGLEASADRFLKHTHWLRPKTRIRNLFLVGQDAFSMGFCGAMFSARLTYSAITENWPFVLRKDIGVFP